MNDENVLEKEEQVLAQISAHLDQYGDTICALIIEPLVQGCSGMRMCTPRFMQALEKLVRSHGILIIYDEVMTGFGRTGSHFACVKSGTSPDIICLAKALTGGYLPVSVTVCSEKIYQAFLGDTVAKTLFHGHSFTANPMGCAAALASLKLLQQPEVQQQIALFEQIHREELPRMAAAGIVENVRYCGTIAAFNFKIPAGYGSQQSKVIQNNFHSRGLIVRPLGNVFYFIPPLCVTETELRGAYAIAIEEMQGVTA
jgi:adenosylmethionine-8-amino-7-oxononanoate aminotransferase